jgi:hypothetical protein
MASFNFNGSLIRQEGEFSVIFDVTVKLGIVVKADTEEQAEELALIALNDGDYEVLEIGDVEDTEIEEL